MILIIITLSFITSNILWQYISTDKNLLIIILFNTWLLWILANCCKLTSTILGVWIVCDLFVKINILITYFQTFVIQYLIEWWVIFIVLYRFFVVYVFLRKLSITVYFIWFSRFKRISWNLVCKQFILDQVLGGRLQLNFTV